MQKQFLKYTQKIGLSQDATILVAVSGGLDSVALLHLFRLAGFSIQVAHCNFNLRGEESDADERFVQELCATYDIPFHVQHFDTEAQVRSAGISVQMAARDLRYEWFEGLRKAHGLNYIATAHHQDDQIETLLLNLSRGTGIKGMHGILACHDTLVRPLLFTDRPALESWMSANNFTHREDRSNASLKYSRNKLRHQVIPILKELNPSLSKTYQENAERFENAEQNLSFFYEGLRSKIIQKKDEEQHIILSELFIYPSPLDVLFYFIHDYGFNDWKALENLMQSESGKVVSSATHDLLKDRDAFILRARQTPIFSSYTIDEDQRELTDPISLSFSIKDAQEFTLQTSSEIAALDYNALDFPLELRKWQKGDVFKPLGMKGKKKLSDFFVDQKLSLFEKENTWILCSAGRVVWILGHRIDERFKLVEATQKVYLVELNGV